MEDLKEEIVEHMFNSMNSYSRSDDCLKKENVIRKSLEELYEILSVEQHKKLIIVLDLINDSDCCYAEEAYYRGFIDALAIKIQI